MNPTAFLSPRRYLLGALAASLVVAGTAEAAEEGSWLERVGGAGVVGAGKLAKQARAAGRFQGVRLPGSVHLGVLQAGNEGGELRAAATSASAARRPGCRCRLQGAATSAPGNSKPTT